MEYKDINDYEVLYLIGEEQSDSKNIIFQKYKPILVSLSNKYYSIVKNRGIEYDDIYQEALIGLNYAIDHFDGDKNNTFYTYAILCINSRLKTYVHASFNNKNKVLNESLSLDQDDNNFDSIGVTNFADDYTHFYDRIIQFKNNLDYKKAQIFELKCNGFSNKEIGFLLELPVKNVYYCVCSIRNKLTIGGFSL